MTHHHPDPLVGAFLDWARRDVPTYAHCPKCRGRHLSVIEFTDSVGVTDFHPVRVEDGKLIPGRPFYFEPGDITRVELECTCGHRWKSRRAVGYGGPSE